MLASREGDWEVLLQCQIDSRRSKGLEELGTRRYSLAIMS
jgi:hypothetical protein